MAIALQDGVLVWQKVAKALTSANPASQKAFYDLKTYLVTQGQNPQLQFVPFTAEQIVTNNGYSPDVDACTIYGVYLKGRRTTGTTSSFVAIHDAADNAATTTTIDTARFKAAGQSVSIIHPTGVAIATDITVSGATTVGGPTESSAADAADGFLVIGA
jgi:hypothetical protein